MTCPSCGMRTDTLCSLHATAGRLLKAAKDALWYLEATQPPKGGATYACVKRLEATIKACKVTRRG